MRNRDMPAKPIVNQNGIPHHHSDVFAGDGWCHGLTKLEYAAIQIMAGNQSIPGTHNRPTTASFDAVEKANALFDELEQEQSE